MTTTPEPARDNPAAPPPWFRPTAAPNPAVDSRVTAPSASADLVLVFASTTEVLNAEDLLESGDFKISLIPVPKEVNPNCGLALSFPEDLAPDIERALVAAGLGPTAVYRHQGGVFLPSEAGVFTRPAEPLLVR